MSINATPRWAILSIALNLFLLGWLASHLMLPHPPKLLAPPFMHGAGMPLPPPPMAALMQETEAQVEPHFVKIRRLQRNLQTLARQDKFDQAAFAAKIGEMDTEMNAIKEIVQPVLLNKLAKASQAERAHFADMLPE